MGARITKIAGIVWLVIAAVVIASEYASILYLEGWTALQDTISPFHLRNYIAVAVILAPGVVLLECSERLSRNKTRSPPTRS
jgi:hypothetical protein